MDSNDSTTEEKDLLDAIADSVTAGHYKEGWDEDKWEEQIEEHPLFMTKAPETGKLPPLVEAISQIKYDEELNSKLELAISYKEDGNNNFKIKKYNWAVDCYTKGLDIKCEDKEVNSVLHNNRASAHFYLKNYRSALNDAQKAIELNPKNEKAVIRVAQCLYQLERYRECIEFCQKSEICQDKLSQWKEKAQEDLKRIERDARKQKAMERQKQERENQIIKAVNDRKIRFKGSPFEPSHPAAEGNPVHLDAEGKLIWPVLFVYPEYGQTDFIQSFHEDDDFLTHLKQMFPMNNDHPAWDVNRKYRVETLKLAFQDPTTSHFIPIKPHKKLKDILSHERLVVISGVPTFIVALDNNKLLE